MTLEKIILHLTHIHKDKACLLSGEEARALRGAIDWLCNALGEKKLDPSR